MSISEHSKQDARKAQDARLLCLCRTMTSRKLPRRDAPPLLMSDFQELIKNFDRIRDYMRQFFLYGFKVRGEFRCKKRPDIRQ